MEPIHDYAVCPASDRVNESHCGHVHGHVVQADGTFLCWCARHKRQWVQKCKASEHKTHEGERAERIVARVKHYALCVGYPVSADQHKQSAERDLLANGRCPTCGHADGHNIDQGGRLWLWCMLCHSRWRWHSDTHEALLPYKSNDAFFIDEIMQFDDVTPSDWKDRAEPKCQPATKQPTIRDSLVAQQVENVTQINEDKPWRGVLARKPWEYRATAAIPHRNTPEFLELCIRLLERQSEQPYVVVIDTGSDEDSFRRVQALRCPGIEIHQVACHGTEDSFDAVCYAMDLATSICRTEYLWCLHSDCFVTNEDMLAELIEKSDGGKNPAIGYESSSANKHEECKGMVSHTCTLLHMPTMHRIDASWSRSRLETQAKATGREVVFDPEMALNYRLRDRGITPLILGPESTEGIETDANRIHLRSGTLMATMLAHIPGSRPTNECSVILDHLWSVVGGKPCRDNERTPIAPLRVKNGVHTGSDAWEGAIRKKPWEYKVTAAIPVLDTPDELELATELLRLQTEKPYIIVIDTGSSKENVERIEALRADDLEIHYLRFHGRRHSSDFPAVAMDLAFAAAQTDFVLGTHADVFFRRRDLVEWLLTLCPSKSPAVGYEITERPHDDWPGMVSHTCSMYYLPKLDDIGFHWNFRKICRDRGVIPAPDPLRPNWPDTELPGNYALRKHWIQPYLIGTEKNQERTLDENIDHCRSLTAGLIYSPDYYRRASAWSEDARRAARQRIQEWRAAEALGKEPEVRNDR